MSKIREATHLAQAVRDLVLGLGLIETERPDEWKGQSRFGCEILVCLSQVRLSRSRISTSLNCKFLRPSLYSPWRQGDPRNRLFADILPGDINAPNPYSGKYNSYAAEGASTEDASRHFRRHLTKVLP